MGIAENVLHGLGHGSELVRARVVDVAADGLVRVVADAPVGELACAVLVSGGESARYATGDVVLVLFRREAPADAIVLGRIGRADVTPAGEPAASASTHERRVVIEADEELLLRVGDASIQISRDGKVVIRGEHVLTRAKGTNRIKGGSVAIN